jgi:hypothetical protein
MSWGSFIQLISRISIATARYIARSLHYPILPHVGSTGWGVQETQMNQGVLPEPRRPKVKSSHSDSVILSNLFIR